MTQVIHHVKLSNDLSKHNNAFLRVVAALFVVALVLMVVLIGMNWRTLDDVNDMANRLDVAVKNIDALSAKLSDAQAKLQQVKESTDKAEEDRDSQPRVELVPENDPAKARSAPIKVRITPAKDDRPPSSAGAVEVPLPVKDVRAVAPDADGDRR